MERREMGEEKERKARKVLRLIPNFPAQCPDRNKH